MQQNNQSINGEKKGISILFMTTMILFSTLVISNTLNAQTRNALSEDAWRAKLKKVVAHSTQNLSNGKYKGTVSSTNKRAGLGLYWWNSDYCYFGVWKDNDKNGYAINIAALGKDVNYCPNCSFYVGNFSNDKKSGEGNCYDKYGNLIYCGSFSNDAPTGIYPTKDDYPSYKFECIEYPKGGLYIGETKDGVRHGQGIYLWVNGDAWYGPWKNDHREGNGILMYYNGQSQMGFWDNNTYYKNTKKANGPTMRKKKKIKS